MQNIKTILLDILEKSIDLYGYCTSVRIKIFKFIFILFFPIIGINISA